MPSGEAVRRLAGDALVWAIGTTYTTGQLVLDRGGIWQAAAPNMGSRPVSGNANWVLIGGTPYVDVVLDPVDLTTAPFYDENEDGPGDLFVPAPGPGLIVWPIELVSIVTPGAAWGADPGIAMHWKESVGEQSAFMLANNGSFFPLLNYSSESDPRVSRRFFSNVTEADQASPLVVDQPIVIELNDDLSPYGSSSLFVRLYYVSRPAVDTAAPAHYGITSATIATKTFVVADDASGLGSTFSIVGSTGNDATYTKVSATFLAVASHAINAVNHVTKTFTIAGDHAAAYPASTPLTVTGGTDKDGTYHIDRKSTRL